jgi:hypothetical protein
MNMDKIMIKEFFASLVVALVLCVVFALVTRRQRRRTGFVWFFLFVLIATWAGGIWIRPFGPEWGDIHWLQLLVVGLLFVLMFALFAPHKKPRGRHDTLNQLEEIARQKQLQKVAYVALKMVFWVVLCVFILAIIIHYAAG